MSTRYPILSRYYSVRILEQRCGTVWFQPSGMPLRRLGPELSQPPSLSGLGAGALGALGGALHHHGLGLGLSSEKRAPSVEARTAKRRLTRAFSEPIG